jgi:hypothetical protein
LRRYPDISIDLLAQEGFLSHIDDSRVKPFVIPAGPLDRRLIPPEIRDAIRVRPYRLGLVPYSSRRGEGYQNVHRVLPDLSQTHFVGIGSDGRRCPISRYPRLRAAVGAPIRWVGMAAMVGVIAGMFLWFKGLGPFLARLREAFSTKERHL